MRQVVLLVILILAGLLVGFLLFSKSNKGELQQPPTNTDQSSGVPLDMDLVQLDSLKPESIIKSPLTITGKARGFWFFEASFPVVILDANGNRLGQSPAQAQSEWMTTELVPFQATVKFKTSPTQTGYLILMKDNPSGLPENEQEMRYPIRFR